MIHLFAIGTDFYDKVKDTMYNILNNYGVDFIKG